MSSRAERTLYRVRTSNHAGLAVILAWVVLSLVACSASTAPDSADTAGETWRPDLPAEAGQEDLCAGMTCESDGPCRVASCDPESGMCLDLPQDDGSPCDDSDPCTVDDRCSTGQCFGTPLDCPASDPCLHAACNPQTGLCLDVPVTGAACDDANPCTTLDVCQDGDCAGQPVDCDDANPCTSDSCDAATASCSHVLILHAPCNDQDPCTDQDQCLQEGCAGLPRECSDGNSCTADACFVIDGECAHTPLSATPCDDSDACTADDSCAAGICAGVPVECDDGNPCTVDDCHPTSGCVHGTPPLPCDDGNPCTQSDTCTAGECLGEPLSCHDSNPCTLDSCDPDTGTCLHLFVDWPCDDASLCTTGDVCVQGACAGQAVSCDDANPCTADSCLVLSGCKHAPVNAPCDDGNACTLGDSCLAGACQPGKSAPSCDDGNPCTLDSCIPADGACLHKPVSAPCDDGNPCTIDDHCEAGGCVGTDKDACQCANDADCAPFEDGSKCNGVLFCDKAVLPSKCKLLPGSVVKCTTLYDTPCRKALCQPETGVCLPTDMPDLSPCNDADPCTTGDYCLHGECVFSAPVSCDDGNPCTTDSCDSKKGCQWDAATLPCDDGNLCTLGDVCQGGSCVGIPVYCEDANPCTAGVCDPLTGDCSFVPIPSSCNDGNPCTTKDQCVNGICQGLPKDCDDGLSCTEDACNLNLGCLHTPVVGECDDSDGCTAGDVCKGTKCVGVAITCFDGNPCTDDLCVAATGCVFKPNVAPCDDGNVCTYGDMCKNGVCAGLAVSCDDGNPCTSAACHPWAGCVTEFLDKPCTDYSPCTLGDWCKKGSCISGIPVQCDDGNLCTLDFCDPDDGKCRFEPNGFPCDDANSCSTQDHCSNGACLGFPIDCTDLNPCTSDSCISGVGCIHQATNGAFCDDLDPCTSGDICDGDLCQGPEKNSCDDANSCTSDSCIPTVGCKHAKLDSVSCDDGDPDTVLESCTQGTCTGLPDLDHDGIPDGGAGDPCLGGVLTDCSDNCPETPNADQADADADAIGDLCELCGPVQPFDGQTSPEPELWATATAGSCPEDGTWFLATKTLADEPAIELYSGRAADCPPAEVSVRLSASRDLFPESTVVRFDYEWESVATAAAGGPAARLLLDDGLSPLTLYEAQTQAVPGPCGQERHVAAADRSGQFELAFSHADLTLSVRRNGAEVPGSPFDLSGLAPHWFVVLDAAGASFDPACPAHAVIRVKSWSYLCEWEQP